MNKKYSGIKDVNKRKIYVGDTLESPYGYYIRVVKKDKGRFVGKLLCPKTDPCTNMDYSIDNRHIVVGWTHSHYLQILKTVTLNEFLRNNFGMILGKYENIPISFDIIENIKKEIKLFLNENTSVECIDFAPTAPDCRQLIANMKFNDLTYKQYVFTFTWM
jgi:hypothetical protein